MTLLQDILDAAVRSDVPLTDLLRRCKVLSSRLQHVELGSWVDLELNGYPGPQALPDYRILKTVHSKGHFSGPFGSGLRNASIPPSNIPKKLRNLVEGADLREPVSAYAELLSTSDGGTFKIPWPADLVKVVAGGIYENMALMEAWRELPRGSIVSVLDTVRNRILNFALAIQEKHPDAGERASGAKHPAQELVTQVFHTQITGSIGNLAVGNRDVSQEHVSAVAKGDMKALTEYLASLGVPAAYSTDLEAALAEDSKSGVATVGKRTAAWLGRMTTSAFSGALKVSGAVATKLISRAITQYLGLPG